MTDTQTHIQRERERERVLSRTLLIYNVACAIFPQFSLNFLSIFFLLFSKALQLILSLRFWHFGSLFDS